MSEKVWFRYTEGVFSNQDIEKCPETFTVDICQVSGLPDSYFDGLNLDKDSEEYESFVERCDYDSLNPHFYREEDIYGQYGTNREDQDYTVFSEVYILETKEDGDKAMEEAIVYFCPEECRSNNDDDEPDFSLFADFR